MIRLALALPSIAIAVPVVAALPLARNEVHAGGPEGC